jgi:HEAT repeat protein
MDEREKQAHREARLRALAEAAGLPPPPAGTSLSSEALEGPPPINVIISRLTSDKLAWRDECTALLVARGAEAVPALLGALKHASPLVRYHASEALGAIGDDRAIPDLVERLGDFEENRGSVALGAERALLRFGERAVPHLLAAANGGPESVRSRAIRLLGRIRTGVPVEDLRGHLRNGSENVRVQAASALYRVAQAGAIPDLLGAISDPSRYVRCAAAEALAELGRKEARPVLEEVLANPEDLNEEVWAEDLLDLIPP